MSPPIDEFLPPVSPPHSTILTKLMVPQNVIPAEGPMTLMPVLRADRPRVVVSSTSWTADEDFSILIEALKQYEGKAKRTGRLPKLLVIVTGKGPLRQRYMGEIYDLETNEKWEWVRCRSMWLEASDYPLLLGGCKLPVLLLSAVLKGFCRVS